MERIIDYSPEDVDALAALVDKMTLTNLVNELSSICLANAQKAEIETEDSGYATAWYTAGELIGQLEDGVVGL